MAVQINSGRKVEVYNFSVDTSGSTIVINDKNVNSFIIQCRESVDLYIRESAAGEYFTIKAGSSLTLDINPDTLEPFHLTSATGTVNVEIIAHKM